MECAGRACQRQGDAGTGPVLSPSRRASVHRSPRRLGATTRWIAFFGVGALLLASCAASSSHTVSASGPAAKPAVLSKHQSSSAPRCISTDLSIRYATTTSGKTLANAALHSVTIAYVVTNQGHTTCTLDGYMLPEWTNVAGKTAPVVPYSSQSAMASHALRTSTGALIAKPSVIKLPPGGNAGFVTQGSAAPSAYIPPGDRVPVSAPLEHNVPAGTTLLWASETPIFPANDTLTAYSQALGG